MLFRDVRRALRLFVREPGFAATVVLTLALGVGANTALFAIVEAVLLRSLPFASSDALAVVWHRDARTGISKDFIAMGDFVDLRATQRSFRSFAGFGGFTSTLLDEGEPLRVEGLTATPELFDVLGTTVAMGRGLQPDDVREGAAPVVIISHRLWETRFGADPNIAGRSVQIGPTRRSIVGVLPRGFHFPLERPTDVILPMRVPIAAPAERKSGWVLGVGRLADGATIETAANELDAIARKLEHDHPTQNQGSRYYPMSLRDSMLGDTKLPLLILLGAVGFVLVIACVNVGNLLLARSLARQNEMAVRAALGAGRGHLIAQVFVEGLVLAMAGGAVGVAVAWRAVPALAALVPRSTPLPGLQDVGINAAVLTFSLAASIVSALLFSGVACIGMTRNAPHDALRSDRRTTSGRGARRAASTLVATEVALAVVLLLGAALTLRSFAKLISVDPGFRAQGVMTLQFQLPAGRYAAVDARRAFYQRALAALEELPDVESAGVGVVTPLTGNNWTVPFQRADRPVAAGERPPDVGWQAASAGYFRTLNIPLRAGRLFDSADAAHASPVVVISDGIARRFFPGETAVGRRVKLGESDAEIVGVVGDIRRAALTDAPRADMYFPFEQQPQNSVTLFVRVAGDPEAALPALRTTIKRLEPNALVYGVRKLEDLALESAAVHRLAMRMLGGFAAIALTLAAIGIYGVMSYTVRRRGRELGTRLALGATRRDIVRLVLRQTAIVTAIGLAAGVLIGLAAVQSLNAVLYEVTPWDPMAIVTATSVLGVVALLASYLPARRASRIDPAKTLAGD